MRMYLGHWDTPEIWLKCLQTGQFVFIGGFKWLCWVVQIFSPREKYETFSLWRTPWIIGKIHDNPELHCFLFEPLQHLVVEVEFHSPPTKKTRKKKKPIWTKTVCSSFESEWLSDSSIKKCAIHIQSCFRILAFRSSQNGQKFRLRKSTLPKTNS